ncbi:MAG: GPR endopeptidase [Clostridiales bacterium]
MENHLEMATLASRYDLAMEATALLRGDANRDIPGVKEELRQIGSVDIHTITIMDEIGEKLMGKKRGRYITLAIPMLQDGKTLTEVAAITAEELRKLLPPLKNGGLLAVGLGNNQAIADSLGPRVIAQTYATRHLPAEATQFCPICTLAPGVLGITGIETAEILKGVLDHVQPAAMLVVDSLAASSVSRVGTTIQMAENGISPGSGIGNTRQIINSETMGIPVIAIGVPTVVSALSIIRETTGSLCRYWQSLQQAMPQTTPAAITYVEQNLLEAFSGSLMVTPKDIDELIAQVAELLAAAIAMAIHPAAAITNYHDFIR